MTQLVVESRLPKTALTMVQLCEQLDIEPFFDPNSRSNSFFENWEDEIDNRARVAWAEAVGFEIREDTGWIVKTCPLCAGEGEHVDEAAPEGVVLCERCDADGYLLLEPEDEEDIYEHPAYEAARTELELDLFNRWRGAFEAVLEKYLGEHRMTFEHVRIQTGKGKNRYTRDGYVLKPDEGKTWKDVASAVMETINGYGFFYFETVEYFRQASSESTYQSLVMHHLHWLKEWGEVYGGKSPSTRMSDELQDAFRYY